MLPRSTAMSTRLRASLKVKLKLAESTASSKL
jgi:hypothetical protein